MTRLGLPQRLLVFATLMGSGLSVAEEAPAGVAVDRRDEPPRNYGNLRAGASTSGRRPSICLEVSPVARLGVEACGTGSGFLHRDPEPEIAHFRANLTLTSWQTRLGWLQPRLSAGFAELQVGEDSSGFDFGGSGPTGVETAGPEVGASLRALLPISNGFEFVGELGFSAAYFNAAPQLIRPQARFQPSASFTLGVGF